MTDISPSARTSLVLSIRRAVEAARSLDDPFASPAGPQPVGAPAVLAMSSLIMQATRRVRELLLDPDAGPPRFGTVGLMLHESGGTRDEQVAVLELLRDVLEIPDFEERTATSMQQILVGALPRIAGMTRDDDDDDLTDEERQEQLVATAGNAREALQSVGVAISEEQAIQFTHRFWALIEAYNTRMDQDGTETVDEHTPGVAAVTPGAVDSLEDRLAAAYGDAVQQALSEHGIERDHATCKSIMARVAELKFGAPRRPVSEDGAEAEG